MTAPFIRPARPADARGMVQLLDRFAEKGLLLPRSLGEVTGRIRDFMVADPEGVLAGMVALHPVSEHLAEIRSLAVVEGRQGKGLGRALVEAALEDAARLGLKKVFALTYRPGFFGKVGFEPVDKRSLPQKIWSDCVHCAKFTDCDETAVIRDLS
jgi:amino-acid N-acetyltransferase